MLREIEVRLRHETTRTMAGTIVGIPTNRSERDVCFLRHHQKHALSNTGSRSFLVVEFDIGTTDDHAALLLHLAERAPLTLAVHSGRKSLHGWFYCKDQPEGRLEFFMRYAASLGADVATWTRSQFVRMPDGLRENGKHQVVYFFNPDVVR